MSTTTTHTHPCPVCNRPTSFVFCSEKCWKKGPTWVPFVAIGRSGVVMRGEKFICRAASKTLAKRIANALNDYTPSKEGC